MTERNPAQPVRVSWRRRLLGKPAIVAHRAAIALVRRLPAPRSRSRDLVAESQPTGAPRPRPIRIVTQDLWVLGGATRAVFTLAAELAKVRPVELLNVGKPGSNPFYEHPPGVTITLLDDPAKHDGAAAKLARRVRSLLIHPEDYGYPDSNLLTDLRLLAELRRSGDAIVITTRPAYALAALAATGKAPDATIVAQEHMHLRAHRPALAADVSRHYGGLDVLIVLSEGDRADYAEILAGTGARVERIPNGVPSLPPQIKDEPDGRHTIVAAGRLTRQKGFDLLIDAFSKIAQGRPDWDLKIYGAGLEEAALARQITAAGLDGRAQLMGSTRDMAKVFAGADIFVLSSRFEGFGLVLAEAMSCGVPVVSFDCPHGPSEIVTPEHDGLLVPAEDVDAMAAALATLIADPDARRRYGEAGRESAKRFDPALIAERWQRLLATLA